MLGKGDGTVQPISLLRTGQSGSLVVADFNNDGELDVAGIGTGTLGTVVSVYLGDGNGVITWAHNSLIRKDSGLFMTAATADFDGDGLNDIVVSNLESSDISILQNLGGGSLDAMRKLDAGTRPIAFVAGDVNGDQRRDLIVANQLSGDISVFVANPSGFDAPLVFPLGFSPKSIKIGDVDGDKNLDVVALSSDGNTVGILFGTGTASFHDLTTLSSGASLCCIELSDMNGDKRDDLVYAEEQGTLGVRLSTLNSFGPPSTVSLESGVTALAVGDLDNDFDHDVAVATTQHVFTFKGSPSGALTPGSTINVRDTNAIAIAPIDADNFPDIIVGSTDITVLYGDLGETYIRRDHLGVPADRVTALSIADLDGDSRNDIAATLFRSSLSEHFATFYLNRGFGLEAQPAVQTDRVPIAILAASLTPDDNLPDLVIAAAGKALLASSRCAPPAVTVGVASPRLPVPNQPVTFVANAVAGAAVRTGRWAPRATHAGASPCSPRPPDRFCDGPTGTQR